MIKEGLDSKAGKLGVLLKFVLEDSRNSLAEFHGVGRGFFVNTYRDGRFLIDAQTEAPFWNVVLDFSNVFQAKVAAANWKIPNFLQISKFA